MAASDQLEAHVTLVGDRIVLPPTSTVGAGVTDAALHMFSNFVELAASNVENRVATRSQVRRSVRFADAESSVAIQCPPTLATPLQPKVRAVCALHVSSPNIRVRRATRGYRPTPAPRPWVPFPRAWAQVGAIISWLPDVHAQFFTCWPGRREGCGVPPPLIPEGGLHPCVMPNCIGNTPPALTQLAIAHICRFPGFFGCMFVGSWALTCLWLVGLVPCRCSARARQLCPGANPDSGCRGGADPGSRGCDPLLASGGRRVWTAEGRKPRLTPRCGSGDQSSGRIQG